MFSFCLLAYETAERDYFDSASPQRTKQEKKNIEIILLTSQLSFLVLTNARKMSQFD